MLCSLNAEPGDSAALPGCTIEVSHDWLGWPLVPEVCGSAASATLPSVHDKTIVSMVVSFVLIPQESDGSRSQAASGKVTSLLLFQSVGLGPGLSSAVRPRRLPVPAES